MINDCVYRVVPHQYKDLKKILNKVKVQTISNMNDDDFKKVMREVKERILKLCDEK
jgi:hypothetical protein